jgi:uncharacterized protein YrrD
MTTPSEVIRQSDLLNELVLNRNTLEEIGRVEVLWMYPQAHRVLGFICKSGLLGNQKYAFQLSQIDALGDSGVITHAQPEKTEAEKVRQLESLIGLEIWSDEGNRLGKIIDCLFHLHTGEITHYLFVSSGWASLVGEVYQLPPSQIQSFGKRRVLVSESAAARFNLYRPGISQKLSQATEAFREEAVQEWSTITKRAETTTEQAKTRAQEFSQQFKQKAQVWNEQVKEKTQTWLEQAKEKSQTLAERVIESTQALSEQIEERIETLTVQEDKSFDSFDAKADEDFDLDDFDLEADWFDEPVASVNQPVDQPVNQLVDQPINYPDTSMSASPPAAPVIPPASPTAIPLPPLTLPNSAPTSEGSPLDAPSQEETPQINEMLEEDDDPWI